jgi:hypothetical protein
MLALFHAQGEMSWPERLTLIGLFGIVIALVFALRRGWHWVLVRRAESWCEVEGVVVTVDVRDNNAEGALANVGYSYSVSGEAYGGNVKRQFMDAQRASEFANGCKNMKILVHYKPDHPEKSVVWKTIH